MRLVEIGQWLILMFLMYRMGINDGRWRVLLRRKNAHLDKLKEDHGL